MRPGTVPLAAVAALVAAAALAQGSGGDGREGPVRLRPPGREASVPLPAPRPAAAPGMVRAPEPAELPEPEEAEAGPPPGTDPDLPVVEAPDLSVFEGVFVPYRVTDGRAILASLTGRPGDPAKGRSLFYNASRTGCSLCHGSPELPREGGDDRTAPDLYRVGGRLSRGHMRLWVVAPETISPGTEMPAFHKPGQRTDPSDPLFGGPRLTAEEVEDVVAYLADTTGTLGEAKSE